MDFRSILHVNREATGKIIGFSAFIFIVLIAALLVSPLWNQQGIPGTGSDVVLHVHRAAAMARSLKEGVFWPRWLPIAYQGLRSPVFHHYSPGFYWLVAATHSSGFRLDESLKIVITGAFILSGNRYLRVAPPDIFGSGRSDRRCTLPGPTPFPTSRVLLFGRLPTNAGHIATPCVSVGV